MSEHEANTERLVTKNSSMRHVEGGWPKDVDFTEQSDVSRFRKKAEKDEDYKGAVKVLGPIVARCMKQINTIDIYEVKSITILLHSRREQLIKIKLENVSDRSTLTGTTWIIPVSLQVPRVSPCSVTQMS